LLENIESIFILKEEPLLQERNKRFYLSSIIQKEFLVSIWVFHSITFGIICFMPYFDINSVSSEIYPEFWRKIAFVGNIEIPFGVWSGVKSFLAFAKAFPLKFPS